MEPIKVYIADDHNLVVKGIANIMLPMPEIASLEIYHDGKQLFDACTSVLPDLVFLDLSMPVWDGRKTLVELKAKYPYLRCIMLSMNNETEVIDDCIAKGASGYLHKDCTEVELREAINTTDEIYFSKDVLKALCGYSVASAKQNFQLTEPLTDREREILKFLCEGLTPREIADKVYLSHRTIETHKKNIMDKFQVNSVGKLISVTLKNNLIA